MHDKKYEGNTFSLAYSPCPNDTFMMDALVHAKIDSPYELQVSHMDIQALNEAALTGRFDITKISAAALPLVSSTYTLLDAGAAMGFGCGPIIVSKTLENMAQLAGARIGIPGRHTTAHHLFNHFGPKSSDKKFLLFSEIEQKILSDDIDAGVLIHEGRFTYAQHGLKLLADLGDCWEKKYHLAIPLGVIVCKKSLGSQTALVLQNLIRKSIQFALDDPTSSIDYVKLHAQELDDEVISQHINLYVNILSLDMGEEGRRALGILLSNPV